MTKQAEKVATREPLFVSASYRGAGSARATLTQRCHGTAAKSAPRWRIARFISDNLQDELTSDIRFQPLVVIYKSLLQALKGRVISRKGATGDDTQRGSRIVRTLAPLNLATLNPAAW